MATKGCCQISRFEYCAPSRSDPQLPPSFVLTSVVGADLPRRSHSRKTHQCQATPSSNPSPEVNRRAAHGALIGSSLTLLLPSQSPAANKPLSKKWELIDLPVDPEVVLLDIGFTGSDPNHGFLLGTRQTLLETFDGGKTWETRSIQAAVDEGFNYRFNSISFNKDEGWIVGKPSIILHTTDGGKNWERIPISSKLPGSPLLVTALAGEPGQAEMTTEQGAIYVTNNAAYTWQAAVQETVDATLNRTVSSGITGASYYEGYFANIRRSPGSGQYVAVSSRGNFYMTWSPGRFLNPSIVLQVVVMHKGDAYWMPHNRPVNRRVQNMGWTAENKLWITSRGGELSISNEAGIAESFVPSKIGSRGFGLLDLGFRDENEAYACGGGGSLFESYDGGKTWKRDRGADNVPGNLYLIKFFNPSNGYVLGNNKILFRYIA